MSSLLKPKVTLTRRKPISSSSASSKKNEKIEMKTQNTSSSSFESGGGNYNIIIPYPNSHYLQKRRDNFIATEKLIVIVILIVFFGYVSWIVVRWVKRKRMCVPVEDDDDKCSNKLPCLLPRPPRPSSSSASSSCGFNPYPGPLPGPSPGPGPGPSPGPAPGPCPAPSPCNCGASGSVTCSCSLNYEPCSTPATFPTAVACKYNIYERFDHINDEMKYAKYNTTVSNYLVGARLFDIESTIDALKENVEIIPDSADIATFQPTFYTLIPVILSNLNQTLDAPCSSFTFQVKDLNQTPALTSPLQRINTVYRIDILARTFKDPTNSLSSTVTDDTIVIMYANGVTTNPIAKFVVSSTATPAVRKIYIQEDLSITSLTLSTQYNGLIVDFLSVYGEGQF